MCETNESLTHTLLHTPLPPSPFLSTSILLAQVNQASAAAAPPGSLSGGIGRGGGGGKYVIPSLREGSNKKGESMLRNRTQGLTHTHTHTSFLSSLSHGGCSPEDQAAVRVTNLSEEATEADLRELFGHFGSIQRVFLAKDKRTQQSKVCIL